MTTPPTPPETTARSSLNGLWSDEISHPDSIYGRLSLPDSDVLDEHGDVISDEGKLLEFPNPIGTDELNHFMVFTIYTGLEGTLNSDAYQSYVLGEAKDLMWSAAMGTTTLLGGLYATSRIVKNVGKKKIKVGRYGGAVGILTTLAATGLMWSLGDEVSNATRTEEEQEAIKNFTELVEKMAQDANDAGGGWYQEGSGQENLGSNNITRFGRANFRHKDTIALYMPQKVQAMSLLEYEQQDMSFVHKLLDDWSGLAAGAAFAAIPKAADAVAGIFGQNTNVNAAVYGAMRLAPNPRKQLMFREPISRKFEFNFNFSPRNEVESAKAYEIIKTFKKHAYPTLNEKIGSGAYYTFPAEFEIKYYTINPNTGNPVENDFINKIGRCALREINVDYASSGSFSTFENGAPTNMIVSLTFEEMELLDSGLIELGY